MPTKDFLEDKQQVTLYPTKTQHKKLKEFAAKRGKNLSTYILDSALRDEKIHEKLDKIIAMLEGKEITDMGITVSELKETVKQVEKPKQEFRSFPKGGK